MATPVLSFISSHSFEFAILGGIICLLIYHIRRLPLYKHAWKYSGPPAIPVLGNAHLFIGNSEDHLNRMIELTKLYESTPFRVWMGPRLMIVVCQPEEIKAILCSQNMLEKGDMYRFLSPWTGTGLFTAPAAKWRVHRRLISPCFSSIILKTLVEAFATHSEMMARRMEQELDGAEFDILEYLKPCTLDIVCETMMGVATKEKMGEEYSCAVAAERVSAISYERMVKVWLQPDFIFSCTRQAREMMKHVTKLHAFTNDVIKTRKEARMLQGVQQSTPTQQEKASNQGGKKAFLDLLLDLVRDGAKLSDQDLREEVDTMMINANDTTAGIIQFTMLMLASFPDVQDKVYQELYEIYGNYDNDQRSVTSEDLPRMEYMERVIKETMRLFPATPIIARSVVEDFDIGELVIPKGSTLIVGIISVHRSEVYWPDPLRFDPDRFLPEEIAKRHPYCWIPFSAGPRNCIGGRYAMMKMKTLLATVLRKYRLKIDNIVPVSKIKLKVEVALRPTNKIRLKIQKRESNA